jgi:hypothetical protein
MKKTVLLTFLFFAISCQESPSPALGDDPDETIDLLETVPVDLPDTNSGQISTSPVELNLNTMPELQRVYVIPNDKVKVDLWPLKEGTVPFEPHNTNLDTVDTEVVEDTEFDTEVEGTDPLSTEETEDTVEDVDTDNELIPVLMKFKKQKKI